MFYIKSFAEKLEILHHNDGINESNNTLMIIMRRKFLSLW